MTIQLKTKVKREDLVSVALGEDKADVVIKGGEIVNVASGEIHRSDVAIKGERIALVGDANHTIGEKTNVINAEGLFLCPGLMDAHVHFEASMVTPTQLARVILPRGNTTILWEPLWTGNVLGVEGVKFFLEEGNKTPLKFFATASSGVPMVSPHLLTPGYEFGINEIREMLEWDRVVGLGEVIDFNSVLAREPTIFEKMHLAIKEGKLIDGNAPQFKGKNLNAYVAAGAQSDHEAVTLDEAIERIRLGLRLVIREGSSMRNLSELIKAITEKKLDPRHCLFCVDDKDIRELVEEGSIDYIVRRAIEIGVDPVVAVQMASLNISEYIGVDRDLGSITPGKVADLLFIDDLEKFTIQRVMVNGSVIAEEGKLIVETPPPIYPEWALKTIRLKRAVAPEDFVFKTDKIGETRVRVIKVFGDQIISTQETETLAVKDGEILPDPAKDILKIVVVERYGKTEPNIGKGFVRGFGFKQGAIASSVSPDHHHIIAVGKDNADLSKAINRLVKIQGGIVICKNGEILDELPLAIGGIVSPEPYEKVANKLRKLHDTAKELGCPLPAPFMTLAFVGTPSLTAFKLSDKGLIDVLAYGIVPLEIEAIENFN